MGSTSSICERLSGGGRADSVELRSVRSVPIVVATAIPQGVVLPMACAVPVATGALHSGATPVVSSVPSGTAWETAGAGVPQPRALGGDPVLVRATLSRQKRSVLVGINYTGTGSELSGCVADVARIQPLLEQLGFLTTVDCQMVLTDDGQHQLPTRDNMIAALQWLVSGVETGDALFFHYSGHGGRAQCSKSEAADGFHETLCPLDYDSAGMLEDTELFELLVKPLPSGVRLTCLLDACHSAGALNLPYLFTGTKDNLHDALCGKAIDMVLSKDWCRDVMAWNHGNPLHMAFDALSMGLGLWNLRQESKAAEGANEAGFKAEEAQNVGLSVGEVLAITGCRSDQTSADVGRVSGHFNLQGIQSGARTSSGGALTSVFIESLTTDQNVTTLQLLERMRKRLEDEGFDQVPQVASSLLIELQTPFRLDEITLPPQPSAAASDPRNVKGVNNFLSGMARRPTGQSMMMGATAADGSTPWAQIAGAAGAGALLGFLAANAMRSNHAHTDLSQVGGFMAAPAATALPSYGEYTGAATVVNMYAGGEDERPGQDPPPPGSAPAPSGFARGELSRNSSATSSTCSSRTNSPSVAQKVAKYEEPSAKVTGLAQFDRILSQDQRQTLLGREDPLLYPVKTLVGPSVAEHPVCLVTQCSVDRLDRLQAQLMSWEGEVSAAIFVDEEPNSEAAGRMCEEIVRVCDEAAFQGHRSPWTITAVFRVDASEIRCAAYDCLYPINALRNVALRAASAEFVFLLDVDFVPSRGLQALDASTLRRLLSCGEDAFAALVIPAFEVRSQSCLPTSGFALRQAYVQGAAQAFHVSHFPAGHRATNFHRWLDRSSESGDGPHFYSVEYEEGFEPYVIALRSRVPPYDERFRGYGMNKISHVYEMNARGCTFRTLDSPESFVVAREHQRSKSWHLMYDAGHEDQRARLAYHFAQFKTEIQTLSGCTRAPLNGFRNTVVC